MTRFFMLTTALTLSTPAFAQGLTTPDLSPAAQVMQAVGVAEVTVTYSSPGKRDRTIWGDLVPHGELWRTGANMATTLETSHDLTVGGQEVPAGIYAVFTIPGENEWTVILNTNANQGGTGRYDKALDQARFTVKPQKGADRERLTFLFSNTTASSSDLELVWAGTRVVMPIEVDTNALVLASVDAYMSDAAGDLTSAARHLLREGHADKALELIDAAIGMNRTWFNVWIKAEILHEQGDNKEARKVAQRAMDLGNKAENFFWKDRVEQALAEWPKR